MFAISLHSVSAQTTAQNQGCTPSEQFGVNNIFRNLGNNVCTAAERQEQCLREAAWLVYQFKIQCQELYAAFLRGYAQTPALLQIERIREGTREFVKKYSKPNN
jgi:hypothetical protein